MSVMIERAKREDVSACIDIFFTVWGSTHEGYIAQIGEELHDVFMGEWRETDSAQFEQAMLTAIEENRGYVAKVDGVVAGFIYYRVANDTGIATIGRNAVDPSYRGRGIGNMLYGKVMDAMREEGITYVTVLTGCDDAHAAARRAYEKAGFSKSIKSIRYYQKL